jgi:K+/H+ antiporter YhaU regulatory subunit KhtT
VGIGKDNEGKVTEANGLGKVTERDGGLCVMRREIETPQANHPAVAKDRNGAKQASKYTQDRGRRRE